MSGLTLTRRDHGVRFSVHVQPRAARTEVRGVHNGALRVRVQAPPVNGAANAALVELLAGSLGVPRRSVRVVSGETARLKVVDIEGVDAAAIERLTSVRP
ncbi:MAG TPA: DUF167 domain-containing protein [Gemmatimonadaceae bacterium]|jgi:hypothetical protein|nr:DUF167 domain-containing protein [Gemmatimonadaceae bacterium]